MGNIAYGTISASSGDPCPCSGEWEMLGSVATTAVFAAGRVVPSYFGKIVIWVLIRRE